MGLYARREPGAPGGRAVVLDSGKLIFLGRFEEMANAPGARVTPYRGVAFGGVFATFCNNVKMKP